jgi:hypothetical protein
MQTHSRIIQIAENLVQNLRTFQLNEKGYQKLQKLLKYIKNYKKQLSSENIFHELIILAMSEDVSLPDFNRIKIIAIFCSHNEFKHHLDDLPIKNCRLFGLIQNACLDDKMHAFCQSILANTHQIEQSFENSVRNLYSDFDSNELNDLNDSASPDVLSQETHNQKKFSFLFNDIQKESPLYYLSKPTEISRQLNRRFCQSNNEIIDENIDFCSMLLA